MRHDPASARLFSAAIAVVLVILSQACAHSGRPLTGLPANGIAPDESARVVDIPSLGIRVTLGRVEEVVRKGEFAIEGGNPDGPMSADIVGRLTKVFFTCWDGKVQLSCLSENSSIDTFNDLSGLYKNSRGTQFRTVMEGSVPGDPFDSIYAALQSTWREPSTEIIHGWYHAEIPVTHSGGCYATYASIGYATSTNGGHSFRKHGVVLTSPYPNDPTVCLGQGVQGPKVIESGPYLYMFFTIENTRVPTLGGVGIARASIAKPDDWHHYNDGAFDQPGLGGEVTPIIARGGMNRAIWNPSVSWNNYLQKYVMLHTDYDNEGAIYIRTSDDMFTWSAPILVMPSSTQYGYRYATLFGQTDDVTAQNGWLYFGRTVKGGALGPDTLMARRRFVFERISP